VQKGKVVWTWAFPIKDKNGQLSEFSDIHRLSNGNVLYAAKTGAAEVTPQRKLYGAMNVRGFGMSFGTAIGKDKVFLCLNGTPAKALLINKITGKVEMEHEYLLPGPMIQKVYTGNFAYSYDEGRYLPAGPLKYG